MVSKKVSYLDLQKQILVVLVCLYLISILKFLITKVVFWSFFLKKSEPRDKIHNLYFGVKNLSTYRTKYKNNQNMSPILFHRIWKRVVLVTAVIMVKLLLKSYIVGQTAIIIIMGCIIWRRPFFGV